MSFLGPYNAVMKNFSLLKQAGLGVGFVSAVLSTSALAQTPVSTSVQMSGSCSKCDLSHRDMERMSLQGSNFSGSNFSHSNLSGGKFYKSNLAGATFNKAYMMRIEGDGVILHKSNLRDATLSEATLTNSNISHADLRRADLTEGNFEGSSFERSILKATDAMDANFKGANFHGAYLTHGNFTDADFSNAKLTNTIFGQAILEDCEFEGANLSGANLSEVIGLNQGQLDQACGNEKTILPEGLSIKSCPTDQQDQLMADAQGAYESTYTVVPITPAAPKAAAPVPYYLQSEVRKFVQVKARSDIDLAITEVSEAMKGLPLGSPTRTRLQNALNHMEKMRAQDQ
jgi:uncharacterized protein YjbI with pentapeptide repeats